MERSGGATAEPEVPLADAGIAAEIARAAAKGRGADRSPTLEQLLAAFSEPEPTEAARRRVRAALQVVGMGVRPDVLDAEPGQRVLLLPSGTQTGRRRSRAIVGLLALAGVIVAAAAAAAVVGNDNNGGDRASDALPPATTATRAGSASAPPATTTTPASGTAPATTTTAPADDAAAARRARARRARARREREARRLAAAERSQTVTVRVDASARPTFLCADDGHGSQLFGGTLSGRKTFKARRVRLNIGLASTRVTVNGTPVTLQGSPAGLDITRKGGARTLPLGNRPCG